MGVSSSAGPGRPGAARRTIRFTFATRVAVPAACLALLWMLALAAALRLALSGRTVAQSHGILAEYGLLAAGGVVVIIVAAMLLDSFGRRISGELADLADAAERLAEPTEPAAAAGGGAAATPPETAAVPPAAQTAEIVRAQAAVASLRQRAAAAAASESGLRDGLRQVFVSLAKRNQSLLQRQLRLIDTLEQKASDPAALADLFSLDHLTTRMRRHAESLAILSGAEAGRTFREPVPVIDVIRGAVAEVEDYRRVSVLTTAEDAVVGPAVADMIHLLAELVENAALYSPSGTQVEIRAGRVANGFAIEIDDRGLGIDPGQLREINEQLARPPGFDLADADRLGLFVGGKLAARHGVRVSLRASPYGGTSAIVLLPNSVVVPGEPGGPQPGGPQPGGRPSASRPARLDLSGAAALAVAARRSAQPPPPLPPQPPGEPVSPPGERSRPAIPVGPPGTAVPGAPPRPVRPAGWPGVTSTESWRGPAVTESQPGPAVSEGQPGTAVTASQPGTPGTASQPGTAVTASQPGTPGPEGQPGTAAEDLPLQAAPATHAGLPRRTRQASLSPHLRDSPAATPPPPPASGPAPTPPERARDLAASIQGAWRRSRAADPPDGAAPEQPPGQPPGEPPGKPAVEQDRSETPYSEEAR